LSSVVLDTCTIVNLHKADVLDSVLQLPIHRFVLGPEVLSECDDRCQPILDAIAAGSITLLDDAPVPASLFLELLERHHLGEGETECLVYAQLEPTFIICSDDRAARTVAIRLYGAPRVMGSIRLLFQCVEQGVLTADLAFAAYERMIRSGGFLPVITKQQFLDAEFAG